MKRTRSTTASAYQVRQTSRRHRSEPPRGLSTDGSRGECASSPTRREHVPAPARTRLTCTTRRADANGERWCAVVVVVVGRRKEGNAVEWPPSSPFVLFTARGRTCADEPNKKTSPRSPSSLARPCVRDLHRARILRGRFDASPLHTASFSTSSSPSPSRASV